jgi:hypothetical protein
MSRLITPTQEMRAAAPDLIGALEPVYMAETEAERAAAASSATPTMAATWSMTPKTTSRIPPCSTPTMAPAS